MANLRSRIYGLDEMEKIDVKLKAGRIVPALSTTTSVVAGYQTIQLIMILKETSKPSKENACRNIFINLAVPIIQIV